MQVDWGPPAEDWRQTVPQVAADLFRIQIVIRARRTVHVLRSGKNIRAASGVEQSEQALGEGRGSTAALTGAALPAGKRPVKRLAWIDGIHPDLRARWLFPDREGQEHPEIARALGITEATVKCHVGVILLRLNVTDRTRAVVAGLQRGLVDL